MYARERGMYIEGLSSVGLKNNTATIKRHFYSLLFIFDGLPLFSILIKKLS